MSDEHRKKKPYGRLSAFPCRGLEPATIGEGHGRPGRPGDASPHPPRANAERPYALRLPGARSHGMVGARDIANAGGPFCAAERAAAARLVGLGFRYWLKGFRTGDISCWERAWCAYCDALGAAMAKGAVADLACWVGAI